MAKVYITDRIEEPTIEETILGKAVSCEEDTDAEVLLAWHKPITAQFMNRFPKLKAIVRYGVGYDNVDLTEAKARNILVCNTPDYGVDEVSDSAVAMILCFTRDIFFLNHTAKIDDTAWTFNRPRRISRNSATTIGILGAGRIGGTTALKLKALKYDVVFFDPYKERGHEKLLNCRRAETLDEVLTQADMISIHTPLTDETKGMVDVSFVSKMKNGASLVNTARGKILSDVDVLYEPLKCNRIANVGLDVIPDEPPKASKLLAAWKSNAGWLEGRVIVTPHHAFYSIQAYDECRLKAAQNTLRILEGKMPYNIIG